MRKRKHAKAPEKDATLTKFILLVTALLNLIRSILDLIKSLSG